MPPPMTTCSICKKEVMKAQTYHVGDGKRACKEHEGVVDKKTQLEVEAAAKKEKEIKDKEAAEQQREQQTRIDQLPFCWLCHAKGVTEQDIYANILITTEKEKLKGNYLHPFVPDYHQKMRAAMGLKDGEVLTVITSFACEHTHPITKKLKSLYRQGVGMFGWISLCQDCSKKNGFEKPPSPKINMDMNQLQNWAVIYEMSRPKITEIAQRALDREKNEKVQGS